MKPKRETTSAPLSAPQGSPPVKAPDNGSPADKTNVLKLIPGVNVFCVDCQAFNARTRRCHLFPPHQNNSFTCMRGAIDTPKEEWCMQFKLLL